MQRFFGVDQYGRQNIVSHYDHCDTCHRLAALSSYTTTRFINLRQFPLIPLGKTIRIIDECPYCGHRSITSNRKYQKKRKKELAAMMDAFASEGDNPYAAMNGLQTLMVYDEELWFMHVMQSYGCRFETHMVVQLLIAQGLCRFGHYLKATTYSRKAIALGAGAHAEELLAFCESRFEKKEAGHVEPPGLKLKSILRPYAFVAVVMASLFITLVANGIFAMYNYTAWLVNGSHLPYSVEIDGNRYQLDQYGLKQIKLRLGKHQMQVHGLTGRSTPISFNYKTSLLKQKLGVHALVLNPDAIAVMVEETLFEGQTTNRYRFGKIVYALEGIDYPFSAFPIWVDSKHSTRTRLFNHIPASHLEMVEFLRAHGDLAEVSEYARRILLIDPSVAETSNLLKIATSDLTTDQTTAFLQRGRAFSPPLPVWHRFYQKFMEAWQPDHDLQAEYAMLCKTHPDAPEYYYLLGCIIRNHSTAKRFFERSEEGAGSHGLGYYAIAHDLFFSGQFKEAQPYSERALGESPNHQEFKELERQIHLALYQYNYPLRLVQASLETDPGNGEWVAEKIKYLTLLGEHEAATEAMNSFSGIGENWNTYFHAARFYVVGNTTGYLENLLASGRENGSLQKFLHTGKVKEAHDLLSKNKDHEYAAHLILYCAAKHHGYPKIAETELAKAITEIEKSTLALRGKTSILSAETPPSVKQLLELRVIPKEKAILCTALGFKFTDQRKSFFNLSRKFNYTPEYPQLLLKEWTRQTVLAQ